MTSSIRRRLHAGLASVVLVAAITAVIALLEPRVPALGLGVLYLLAVVPMALVYGAAVAGAVSVASMLAFSYFFVPPRHRLSPGTSERWSVLVAFLVASLVVSQLAARSQRQARRSARLADRQARLADEQAALRHVATLVARGTPPQEVFAAATEEVGQLLPVDHVSLGRYESDGTVSYPAAWSRTGDPFPRVGTRVVLGGQNLATLVFETGRPARMDSYGDASGPVADAARELGVRSAVSAPVVIEGAVWGVMGVGSVREHPLPVDTEARLASFTELVATAISNTEARTEVGRLADAQAALRRVATLVAEGAAPAEVFQTVTREVGILSGADLARMERYESVDSVIGVAGWSRGDTPELAVGTRFSLDGASIAAMVQKASGPVRVDSFAGAHGAIAQEAQSLGIRSSVGCPIDVDGRLWGVIAASSTSATPFPPDTESRIAEFTGVVATAISNAEARTQVGRLADEQAALRRVATLVARESSPSEVSAAVAKEVAGLLGVENMRMVRYEADATVTVVAEWGELDAAFPVGSRLPLGGKNIASQVLRTERPARIEYAKATGAVGAYASRMGSRSAVGAPIVVDGRLWGVMVATSPEAGSLPADTESRLENFTELVATAISNSEARTEVAASRARIVAATDEERRRVVRDLHDGAQQRLVHAVITLKLAHRALQNEEEDLPALLTEALDHAQQATRELRELAHGILPDVLTQGGLRAGVDALASRMALPVENAVSVGRLPAAVEATAYFVVAEALTNVAKHAHARHAEVMVRIEHGTLAVHVRDDGVGGARPDGGSGLIGLADRLAALDGELRVDSPADSGTLVAAAIPLP